MTDPVRTTCAYCGVGCGILATRTGERALSIQGDPEHPANRGRLCSKGTHLGETVGLEGRLLHPMIGKRRASWDKALDLIARRFRDTVAEHGPDSVAFYVSGQLLTEVSWRSRAIRIRSSSWMEISLPARAARAWAASSRSRRRFR